MVAGEPVEFGQILRLLRGLAGWTQEDLAFKAARDPAAGAGVSVSRISELERGIHPHCQKETAERLAAAFGLADPARDVFVAIARGQRHAQDVLTAGIWDTWCEQARRRGQPAPPSSDRPQPTAGSPCSAVRPDLDAEDNGGSYSAPSGRAEGQSRRSRASRIAWSWRAFRHVTLAGAALAVASSIFYAGIWASRIPDPRRPVHMAGASPNGTVLHNGVDPIRAGCGAHAVTLASTDVRLPGAISPTMGRRLSAGDRSEPTAGRQAETVDLLARGDLAEEMASEIGQSVASRSHLGQRPGVRRR